ncbi:hypothetical protein JKP88DRAFT_330017 [Tribonema minus]|uniref:Uncharacterized protein n=1 Tax=Tribonema minus TaxID=303371 RepID=A0A835YRE2_9STRA|nr:hypothetical protein JKP88DRAFT_330017 [Tribonema minus]
MTDASCDDAHVRRLLMMVATGLNRLREQHPWLDGLPRVWQMLGRGYWLTVASVSRGIRAAYTKELLDGALTTLLNNSSRTMVQAGRAELSCDMIGDAIDAGLDVDGHVLIGAAERGCEAALNQWHLSLSQWPAWHTQLSYVLPVMVLRAIGVKERPEALEVLRWVFNTAISKRAEVQLPQVLLTLLAFKCARYGHFDTFCWLYTEGRRLAQQDITVTVSEADLKAFKDEVLAPFRAARTDELSFIKVLRTDGTARTLCTLMDSAIWFGQEEFVAALSRIQWLQNEMGADWPHDGAAHIVRKGKDVDARGVVRMVSDLACPWGPWTSAECALLRTRPQHRSAVPPQSAQHWMQQLHALGCPCGCSPADDA